MEMLSGTEERPVRHFWGGHSTGICPCEQPEGKIIKSNIKIQSSMTTENYPHVFDKEKKGQVLTANENF